MEQELQSLEFSIKKSMQPIDFLNALREFLVAIDSQDPNLFHYEISRKALSALDARFLTNENAIDRLVREFLNHCRQLKEQLFQLYFAHGEVFFWDQIYLKFLSSLGKQARLKQNSSCRSSNSYIQKNHLHFGAQKPKASILQPFSF